MYPYLCVFRDGILTSSRKQVGTYHIYIYISIYAPLGSCGIVPQVGQMLKYVFGFHACD